MDPIELDLAEEISRQMTILPGMAYINKLPQRPA